MFFIEIRGFSADFDIFEKNFRLGAGRQPCSLCFFVLFDTRYGISWKIRKNLKKIRKNLKKGIDILE